MLPALVRGAAAGVQDGLVEGLGGIVLVVALEGGYAAVEEEELEEVLAAGVEEGRAAPGPVLVALARGAAAGAAEDAAIPILGTEFGFPHLCLC